MSTLSASYKKVFYDLRPAKQVERRMMLDALQILSRSGFPIGDYQYTGFGSVAFVDFIMLHRLLGIHKMVSVEHDLRAKRRCKFNRPFSNIELIFGPISDYIPELDRDLRHILWLDYDYGLDRDQIADLSSAASQLSIGSILMITTDLEPPENDDSGPREWFAYYDEHASQYFNGGWDEKDFARETLPARNIEIIRNVISDGLSDRPDAEFLPLFNFLYSDGHLMLTIGGMIGGSQERRNLRACDFSKAPYIRRNLANPPYFIQVPRLTRKERAYLDSYMPCEGNWTPRAFPMGQKEVAVYREIYRFIPAYAELLLG